MIIRIMELKTFHTDISIACTDCFEPAIFVSCRKYQGFIVCIAQFVRADVGRQYSGYHIVRPSVLHYLNFYFLLWISYIVPSVPDIETHLLMTFVAIYFRITAYRSRYTDLLVQYPETGFENRFTGVRIIINCYEIIAGQFHAYLIIGQCQAIVGIRHRCIDGGFVIFYRIIVEPIQIIDVRKVGSRPICITVGEDVLISVILM